MGPKKRKSFVKGKGCLSESFKAAVREVALADPYVVERMPELLEMEKNHQKKLEKSKKRCSKRKRESRGSCLTLDFDDDDDNNDDKVAPEEKNTFTLTFDSDDESVSVSSLPVVHAQDNDPGHSADEPGPSFETPDPSGRDHFNQTNYSDSESEYNHVSVENDDEVVADSLAYQIALRRQNCLVPVDSRLLKVAIPDFDEKKKNLKRNKYLIAGRKYFQQSEEADDGRWIYFCSCRPSNSTYIESLSFQADITQDNEDLCIHIRALKPIIAEIDYWEVDESIIAYQESFVQENEITDILHDKGKVLVVFESSAGIVTNERAKLHCCVCSNSFCVHCGEIRRKRSEENREENPGFLNEFLDTSHTPSTERDFKPKSVMNIPFYPDERMERNLRIPPSSYLPLEDSYLVCQEELYCCSELVTRIVTHRVKLYTKNTHYECVVKDKHCTHCGSTHHYDGFDDSILNMGKFLIHYSLLRDYMNHFLHGKSCTLDGYFKIFCLTQKSSGHHKVDLTYKDFKDSWYGFLSLLEIDFAAGSVCGKCGTEPEHIVCDATGLSHQKKFSTLALQERPSNIYIPKYSEHADRLAIKEKVLRDSFKDWATKSKSVTFMKGMKKLYPTIHHVIEWSIDTFGDDIPKAMRLFFRCLYSSSPVCSYFEERDLELSLKLLQPNCKSDSRLMRQFQIRLPLLFNVLNAANLESCFPETKWKGLLLYLADKAEVPFNNAKDLSTSDEFDENELSSFPNLPIRRSRGNFEQDKRNLKYDSCRKNYKGHPNLTSGIFTIYCPHGICYGFQVMAKEESPNVPFTIFRTRFQKSPRYIVYDNNCSLHAYCLNRDPVFFRETKFLVDRFHWKNHTACGTGYCMNIYHELEWLNSQINEQQNASTKGLKTQLSYMRPDHFMSHCKFFLWYRNSLKQDLL
ncbi:uncharacterized protein [Clytia hemisphaerica]|uniref:uncharacterized protein n=1 Tax=Clytia hemisphaerica TaxID=252671 RepID=UPI0034D60350